MGGGRIAMGGGGSHGGSHAGHDSGGTAVARGSAESGGASSAPRGEVRRGPSGGTAAGGAVSRTGVDRTSPHAASDPGDTVPAYARPREGRPIVGRAVPREGTSQPVGGVVGIYSPGFYGGFYPWAFGGLGFYGYDGFGGYGGYGGYGADPWFGPDDGSYYPQGYGSADRDNGGLKLKIKPSDATVYVDGYYTGVVNDFDGVFQKLTIEPGTHRVEVRAPGYETLTFDVRIEAGHTSTYRGELKKLPN